jgi:hypothetical protein
MSRIFLIQGAPVGVRKGWSVSDKIDTRSTVDMSVFDLDTLSEINVGDEIEILDDGITIFAGSVETVEKQENDQGYIDWHITGIDFCGLPDKRIVANAFENKTLRYIVDTIVAETLSQEGITVGNVPDGPVIPKATFNYISATEVLDYLKAVSGWNWNIDFDKRLHFFGRDANLAPWALTDDVQHVGFVQQQTRNEYRNTVYLRAGQGETNWQSREKPSPTPDGNVRNFTIRLPIANVKPRIFIYPLDVILTAANEAIYEVDPGYIGTTVEDGKLYMKWIYDPKSNVLAHNSGEIALTSNQRLAITYKGLQNLMTMVEDSKEIANRKILEPGTSGIYGKVMKEPSINTIVGAQQFAKSMIAKYGQIQSIVQFETEEKGLMAGQLVSIQKSRYNISAYFLIESIDIAPKPDGQLAYGVKCLEGPSLGGWQQYFRDLIKGNRDLTATENDEVIILLNYQEEKYGYQGSVVIQEVGQLFPSDDLVPSDTLVPGGSISQGVTVND